MPDDSTFTHKTEISAGAPAPLNIAFRVGSFPKLSETFVLKQISGLIGLGHRVTVLADSWSGEASAPDGIAATRYVQPRTGVLHAVYRRLPYRLKSFLTAAAERRMSREVDIVVCNFGWFGEQVFEHTRALPDAAKIVTVFHGDDMSRSLKDGSRARYDDLLKSDGVFLPISDLWRRELLKLGASDSQIEIYHMGVDPDEFAFRAPQDNPDKPFQMIAVGRFVEKKGLEYAIRAVAEAASQIGDRKIHLDLIGDGPLAGPLKALVEELDLGAMVTFHGFLPHAEVAKALKDADAFVLPSVVAADGDMEGIPVSLMEAMASGLPVLSTRHSGIPELIEHGVNGLLADERDVAGLSNQIVTLINDPDGRAARAAKARDTIEQDFNLKTLSVQLSEICHASVHPSQSSKPPVS